MDILRKKLTDGFKSGKLQLKSQNEILRALRLSPSYKKGLRAAINQLVKEGIIIKDGGGLYATPQALGAFTARVKANPQGYAFLIPDGAAERENDYFVPKKHLGDALDGDTVIAVPVRGTDDEARVIKIISRGRARVIGVFQSDRHAGYVIPDDRAFLSDVYIPLSLSGGAEDGDKVVAEVTSYPKGKAVGGKIVEVLGRDGDFFVEEEAILKSYGYASSFPDYVEITAEKAAAEPVRLGGRRDLRGLLTITIDGVDTRDIDDAVSLEMQGENYRLGVHIADVSHYVKFNGCIDKEAYGRGTSVYFPDRVIPMLPKSLSNGACSLNEGEDRYAMSCFMTFDKRGNRVNFELCESVIKSDKRMTYDEVTNILNGTNTDGAYPEIAPMLRGMAELCLLLEGKRKEAGEVSLDVKEAHIYLIESGEIVIPDYERALSHRIIEQFMVSANEAVAEFAERRKAPFLYRIHEQPAPEKTSLLYGFLRDLGVNAKGDTDDAHPADYQRILTEVADKPFSSVVNKVMLRSMQKARYSEENKGHFGLASGCYCHFTSPIRRYPDLFVHRVLKMLLQGDIAGATAKFSPVAKAAAIDTSERERQADTAERDVDDLYKVAYMQTRLGEEYDAVISGVIESGIFAELANTVEGFIRYEALPDDHYFYVPEKFKLYGRKHSFRIGDKVRIKVAACDLGSRKIQFVLV
ncbi:MAG: ribonuclease R [Clostridiales bacterium]|nr:ribonuclease R [Clostridiales bacterium]